MPAGNGSQNSDERQPTSATASDNQPPEDDDQEPQGDDDNDDDFGYDDDVDDEEQEGQNPPASNPPGTPDDSQQNEARQQALEDRQFASNLGDFTSLDEIRELAEETGIPASSIGKFMNLILRGSAYQSAADRNAAVIIEQELGVSPDYARQMAPRIHAELAAIPDPKARQDRNTVFLATFQAEINAAKPGESFSGIVDRIHTRLHGKKDTGPKSEVARPDTRNPAQRPLTPPASSNASRPASRAGKGRPRDNDRGGVIGHLLSKGWLRPEEVEQAERQSKIRYNVFE